MVDQKEARLLHVRSLNYLVRAHPASYVGARCLVESIATGFLAEWTSEYLLRKLATGRRQVYWKYSIFKCLKPDKTHDYRVCLIGSPATNLLETFLLWRLSQDPAFSVPPSVYSYRWSSPRSGQTFRYFMHGYRQREIAIAETLKRNPGGTAVIHDIRRFYPSIDTRRLKEKLENRLQRSALSPGDQEILRLAVDQLTSVPRVSGLPIGPQLSHVLASIYLERVDEVLSSQFPGCYFRYVDDIVLVVPSDQTDAATARLQALLGEDGLELNTEKADCLGSKDWVRRADGRWARRDDPFTRLMHDLRCYLAYHPDRADFVTRSFRDEGFSLPFQRLRSTASYGRYRSFLLNVWHGLKYRKSLGQLLQDARRTQVHLTEQLARSETNLPASGMKRRWALQEWRYLIGRLTYLLPSDQRPELLSRLPTCDELVTTRTLLEALVSGDAKRLLPLPGPTVSAFCQLWRESRNDPPVIDWSNKPKREERDAAVDLGLHGLADPPDEWVAGLASPNSHLFVRLASGHKPSSRTLDDFSYVDEMESLWLSKQMDMVRFLTTRFDDREAVYLPALDVSGDYAGS